MKIHINFPVFGIVFKQKYAPMINKQVIIYYILSHIPMNLCILTVTINGIEKSREIKHYADGSCIGIKRIPIDRMVYIVKKWSVYWGTFLFSRVRIIICDIFLSGTRNNFFNF